MSVWEKCEIYGVKVAFHNTPLEMPRERDKWLMPEFMRLGYSDTELVRLNTVRRFQQVVFLSDIVGASGSGLDERYLRRRQDEEEWSTIKFPQECPSHGDFQLWKNAIWQVVPEVGLPVRLGRFLHEGYKKWEWRLVRDEQHLLHYSGGTMDVYVPTSATQRRWKKAVRGCDVVEKGVPCSVQLSTSAKVAIVSVVAASKQRDLPESFLDILQEWGST